MVTETTIDSGRNERPTGQTRLRSSCDNVKHDLESLLEQIGFSSFLSRAREIITFSPPRTRSKPPSLEALYSFPPFTLVLHSHILIAFHLPLFPCSSSLIVIFMLVCNAYTRAFFVRLYILS